MLTLLGLAGCLTAAGTAFSRRLGVRLELAAGVIVALLVGVCLNL
jgi:hypothetical protein